MKKTNLLIIDDNAFVRQTLNLLLRKNHNIYQASHPESGLHLLKTHEINLVLLDYRMPIMNGFEVLKAIKQYNPQIQICMISAECCNVLRQKAKRLGAIDMLDKPFEIDDLMETLRNMTAPP